MNGTKLKDISSVEIITYTIRDIDTDNKYVLFAFASFGWANEYGVILPNYFGKTLIQMNGTT